MHTLDTMIVPSSLPCCARTLVKYSPAAVHQWLFECSEERFGCGSQKLGGGSASRCKVGHRALVGKCQNAPLDDPYRQVRAALAALTALAVPSAAVLVLVLVALAVTMFAGGWEIQLRVVASCAHLFAYLQLQEDSLDAPGAHTCCS